MSNISAILEGLNQNRLNEGKKKKTIRDLILLRAAYNKDLHDAIESNNQKFVDKFIKSLDADDLEGYEGDSVKVDNSLKKELKDQDNEFNTAHKSGRKMFGE